MLKKTIILFFILFFIVFLLYGNYDSYSIEEYAYVIAIGIDIGSENILKLTLQFAIPDSSGDSSSTQSKKNSITSVECSTIDSGITAINSYISKIVNLSHCKVIVFSEQIAEQGIENYITTLTNNIEIRPDCSLITTRCEAHEYIKNASPILTDLTARYYEVLLNSEAYTGYTVKTPILELEMLSHTFVPCGISILGGLDLGNIIPNDTNNSNDISNTSSLINKSSELIANETTVTGNTISQVMGLAIYKNLKLVGELNSMESICYLILRNKLERCVVTIPSPFNNNEAIDIVFKINNSSNNTVKLVNNMPFIKCDVHLNASIQSYAKDVNYSEEANIKIIENYSSSYIKSKLTDFLYKTSKVYNSDILGFGFQTSYMYSTMTEFENSKWLNNYKNAFFDVNVETKITSTSLFSKK